MSLKDIKNKRIYWDGVNISHLPGFRYHTNGSLMYNKRIIQGDLGLIIDELSKDYELLTFTECNLPICEVKKNKYLVKDGDYTYSLESKTVYSLISKILSRYGRGISDRTISVSLNYRKNITLEEFFCIEDKSLFLLSLNTKFVYHSGFVFPSQHYLDDYLTLSEKELEEKYSEKSLNNVKGYLSAIERSEELVGIQNKKERKILVFKDNITASISPRFFDLLNNNGFIFKPSYDLGKGELGIRHLNTIYEDFYLGKFHLKKQKKGNSTIIVTKQYDSKITSYIPTIKTSKSSSVASVLEEYCYFKGLSVLVSLGLSEAEDRLRSLPHYSIFSKYSENFLDYYRFITSAKYHVTYTIVPEKKQVVFFKNAILTSKGKEEYIKDVRILLGKYKELLEVASVFGLDIPSEEDFLEAYYEIRGRNEEHIYTDPEGRTFSTLKEMAEFWGGTANGLIYKRLRSGWDLKDALVIPSTTVNDGTYDHLGNNYKSFKSMCSHYGISAEAVRHRLNRGMSLKDALTVPVTKRGGPYRSGNSIKKY